MSQLEEVMIKEYADLAKNNTEALTGLKEAIKELNDNNILHRASTEQLVTVNTQLRDGILKMAFVMSIALAILAGAEKILQFVGM